MGTKPKGEKGKAAQGSSAKAEESKTDVKPKLKRDKAGRQWVIIHSPRAGAHCGFVDDLDETEDAADMSQCKVTLLEARWIYIWEGAAGLHELATKGTAKPEQCQISRAALRLTVYGVDQIIDGTEEAYESIKGAPTWTAH